MKFTETANTMADILDKHEAATGERFYAGYENIERQHADHYAGIDEWFLADNGKIYFIYNFDRGNGIVEPILNELTTMTSISAGAIELVVLLEDGRHVPVGYGADKSDRKARAMMAKLAETLGKVGRKVVMTSEPELSVRRFDSEVKCLKSIWDHRQDLIDYWTPALKTA